MHHPTSFNFLSLDVHLYDAIMKEDPIERKREFQAGIYDEAKRQNLK